MARPVEKKSVKAICETGIIAGKSANFILKQLLKQHGEEKEEAALSKSIRYYASGLLRSGQIGEELKAKYVGKPGRGNSAPAVKAKAEASANRKAKAAKVKAPKAEKATAPKAEKAPKPRAVRVKAPKAEKATGTKGVKSSSKKSRKAA